LGVLHQPAVVAAAMECRQMAGLLLMDCLEALAAEAEVVIAGLQERAAQLHRLVKETPVLLRCQIQSVVLVEVVLAQLDLVVGQQVMAEQDCLRLFQVRL